MFSVEWTRRKKIICAVIPSLLVLGIVAWYCMPHTAEVQEREVTKNIDQALKTTAETKITQSIYYEKCGDTEKREFTVKDIEVGLGYNELAAAYPGWNIELFNNEQAKMSFLDKGWCPEHLNHKFVGIQGDYVAIFYGTPTNKPKLKELTQIKVKSLQLPALEEVKRGIAFESNEEMLRILEGMHAK